MTHLGMTASTRGEDPDSVAALKRRIVKLEKINAALMNRVERSVDHQANGYAMFQTAISLESQVRIRTEELKSALNHLESLNHQLSLARDQAEQANNVKTRFFTAVGHDVLQPLHAARLSLSALCEGTETAEQQRLALQVDHALSSVEDLLRTILDISKLEAGVIRPNPQPIALQPLFQSLTVDLEPLLKSKGLRISCRPTQLGIQSDALMLRRILQNLLANALQYTRRGGIVIGARKRGGDVRIEVWDTGPGIPKDEIPKVMQAFGQGSLAHQTAEGGTGLGLPIVKNLMELHGGHFELHSELRKGTEAIIFMPPSRVLQSVGPLLPFGAERHRGSTSTRQPRMVAHTRGTQRRPQHYAGA